MISSIKASETKTSPAVSEIKTISKSLLDSSLFLLFTAVYFGTQLSIVMSFSYSHLAGVNEGVITSVWAVTPLFGPLLDYLVFGVKLT